MYIFLSFPSELKSEADNIAQSLRNRDYDVFFSHDDLPPGDSFDIRVEAAIAKSDFMIFLISPKSVAKGRYTLTELAFARTKWPNPSKRVLPVLIEQTPLETIPNYLKAVTILEPAGNTAAETRAAVDRILGRVDHAPKRSFQSLAVPMVLLSLMSAFACYLATRFLDGYLRFSFVEPQRGTTVIPGLIFGSVVATCSHVFGVRDRFHLALIVLVTTLGWIASVDTALLTHSSLDNYTKVVAITPSSTPTDPSADGGSAQTPTTQKLAVGYLMGIAGGAVGGTITILGLVFANPHFRKLESILLSVFSATAAGAVLGLLDTRSDTWILILFVVWQPIFILSIVRGFPSDIARFPPWLSKLTLSASYTSPDAG
jgi:hypothetical protein